MSIDSRFNQRENLGVMLQQVTKASDGPMGRDSLVGRMFAKAPPRGRRKRFPEAQEQLKFAQISFSVGSGRRRKLTLLVSDPATALRTAQKQLAKIYGGIAGVAVNLHGCRILSESDLRSELGPGRSIEAMLPPDDRERYLVLAQRQHGEQAKQATPNSSRRRVREKI